ncbi:APC family permease [Longispora albida]|uniref:APC family permease n=1 Tax=Longispora albida TaxID=203523 RepID=UPI00036F00DA|nr:APC family permease [Longispora albida]
MTATTRPAAAQHARRPALTAPKVVFLVVAAAAPLAAMVGTVPLAFAIGNGAGVPATFVLAGLTLLCFSVGYAAMSRRIVNTGGFYTYIARGLGRAPALSGGLVAVLAYNAITVGLAGALGYFVHLVAASHGLDLPWQLWSALGIALMAVLGYRQIDLSARLLAVVMIAETGILLALVAAVFLDKGAATFPAAAMNPGTVAGPGLGVALMFALVSYVGFESAALYGEETRSPHRTVPLATYASVVLISGFYLLVSWAAVGAVGTGALQERSARELGDLFFHLGDEFLGSAATTVMQVLLCLSLFGSMLALHNAANRYMYALGRERVLPPWLGSLHPRHNAPHRASMVQVSVTVAVCAVFWAAGLHPYTNLATTMLGLGTLGIVLLQAGAALSVIGFFRGHPDRHWWRTVLAPLLALAGLIGATVLLISNFSVVTGTDSAIVNLTPWLYVVALAAGLGYAWWLRSARPARYSALAAAEAPVTSN